MFSIIFFHCTKNFPISVLVSIWFQSRFEYSEEKLIRSFAYCGIIILSLISPPTFWRKIILNLNLLEDHPNWFPINHGSIRSSCLAANKYICPIIVVTLEPILIHLICYSDYRFDLNDLYKLFIHRYSQDLEYRSSFKDFYLSNF